MKLRATTIVFSLAAIVFLFLAGRYGFTVVKIEDVEKTTMSEAFDPVSYVDGIWDAKIMPTFNTKAITLPTVLSELQVDENGTASKESLIPITQKYGPELYLDQN